MSKPRMRKCTGGSVLVPEDVASALIFLCLAIVVLLSSGNSLTNFLLPITVAIILAVIGAWLIVGVVRSSEGERKRVRWIVGSASSVDLCGFVLCATVYVILIPLVGFWLLSAVMLSGLGFFLSVSRDRRALLSSVVMGILVTAVTYYVMTYVFYVPLPQMVTGLSM